MDERLLGKLVFPPGPIELHVGKTLSWEAENGEFCWEVVELIFAGSMIRTLAKGYHNNVVQASIEGGKYLERSLLGRRATVPVAEANKALVAE